MNIKKAVVHLGAHKTGTTALQRHLKECSRQLEHDGIAFRGPQQPFTEAFRKKTANGAPDLSEERELLQLYPKVSESVAGIKRCLDGADILFILTVRDYGDFLGSCYVQRLKNHANIGASEFRSSLRLADFSWAEMISRMRAAAAPFRLRVHTYDRAINSRIIAEMAEHLGVAPFPSIGQRMENVRYSDTGLRIAQLANPELSPEGRTALRQFLDQHMRRSTADSFSIFPDTERLAMREKFVREVAVIGCDDP